MINVGVCAREREKVIILACGTFSLKGIRAIHSVHVLRYIVTIFEFA